MDIRRRILCDFEQSVLNAESGVLQAEIERRAPPSAHVPNWFALGNANRQPQCQPALAHLGRASENMEPLGEQRVHHEVQRAERSAHQRRTIDGVEAFVSCVFMLFVLSIKIGAVLPALYFYCVEKYGSLIESKDN